MPVSISKSIPTILVDPRPVVRQGLISIISEYAYRVVASADRFSDVPNPAVTTDEKYLVLLGISTADAAIKSTGQIRRRFPNSKIVAIVEELPQNELVAIIVNSSIDGLMSFANCAEILVQILDLVVHQGTRAIILNAPPAVATIDNGPFSGAGSEANGGSTPQLGGNGQASTRQKIMIGGAELPRTGSPRLSSRERQILESLVRGESNKVIARSCQITEATVKVHLKSILKKIQVTNRTQAAIWALENGVTAEQLTERLIEVTADF